MIRVFIGYDPREPVAYHVCANSIIRNSSEPVAIAPLALNLLAPLYKEKHKDGSNDFIYSRFLVPYLCDFSGWAIYLDGDMIVRGDIADLFAERDEWKAAMVVRHPPYTTKARRKYLGAKNQNYPRKNWSSVILWNCGHYHNRMLTPDKVAKMKGAELHRFSWLQDERLGALPREWNWLDTEYERKETASLVHYTLGTPCFRDYAACDHADLWHDELLYAMGAQSETATEIAERAAIRVNP